MGLLEDLKNLYNEAQDEVAQRAKRAAQDQQGLPGAGGPPSIDELRERLRQQARRANAQARPAKAAAAEAPAEQPAAQRHAARAAERHAAERAAEKEEARVKAATASGHARLARLMHQPRTLRDLVILKELLDRPLALRRFPHQR
jgi:hypothetical protein